MRVSDYSNIPIQECEEPLVELTGFPFALEPAQFRKGYTKNPQLWLRATCARRLEDIQRKKLDGLGLRFKIYDAWRPRDVQNKIYAACWNDLAKKNPEATNEDLSRLAQDLVIDANDPDRIPPHCTGGAVDVSLIEDATGKELQLGPAYCGWGEGKTVAEGGHDAESLRTLLIAMQETGFVQDPDQWWHFDYGNQKWARITGSPVAIYGEVTSSMGFMKKGAALGHGVNLPYEVR